MYSDVVCVLHKGSKWWLEACQSSLVPSQLCWNPSCSLCSFEQEHCVDQWPPCCTTPEGTVVFSLRSTSAVLDLTCSALVVSRTCSHPAVLVLVGMVASRHFFLIPIGLTVDERGVIYYFTWPSSFLSEMRLWCSVSSRFCVSHDIHFAHVCDLKFIAYGAPGWFGQLSI